MAASAKAPRVAASGPETELTSPRSQMMQAAQIVQPGQVKFVEMARPVPAPDEVLVEVEGCGVCGSNLPVWEGREWFTYPLAPGNPGHEAWGRIAEVGSGSEGTLRVGDRVAMLSYNGFAEFDIAKVDTVVKLPPVLDRQPFPGEPLACAMNVFARSGIQAGETVAVVGVGFLGATLVAMAAAAGAEVIAITRRPFALEIARHYGAAHTIQMDDHWQIVEQVKGLTRDAGCDCVIEAVGTQWPLDLAAELTRIRGRLIIAGYHQDGLRQVNMQLWNWRGLDVVNAHERDPAVYAAGLQVAVAAVAEGRLDPSPLYTHQFPLDRLGDALTMLGKRPDGFMKALVIT